MMLENPSKRITNPRVVLTPITITTIPDTISDDMIIIPPEINAPAIPHFLVVGITFLSSLSSTKVPSSTAAAFIVFS